MENIINFIRSFIEDEYQANISYLQEKDATIHEPKALKHINYFKMLNPPNFQKDPDEYENEWLEKRKNLIIYKRTLFQIKEYDNEKYGKIYRCYLSDSKYQDKEYCLSVFIAEIKGSLRIFSIYMINTTLEDLKTSLKDWEKIGGEEIKKLGRPTNIVKVEPPVDNEAHLEEYEKK